MTSSIAPNAGNRSPFFGPAWRDSVAAIRTAWPLLFVAVLVSSAAQIPTQIVVQGMRVLLPGTPGSREIAEMLPWIALVFVVTLVIGIGIGVPAFIGAMAAAIDAVRGRNARFKSLLLPVTSVQRYLRTMAVTLSTYVAQTILALVILVPFGVGIWFLRPEFEAAWRGRDAGLDLTPGHAWVAFGICCAVGLVVMALLTPWQARLLVVFLRTADPDRDLPGVIAPMREAWEASRGRGWSIAGFACIASLASLATLLLCCCVGYFFLGEPFLLAALAAAYDRCLPGPREAPPPPIVVGARPPMDSEPL